MDDAQGHDMRQASSSMINGAAGAKRPDQAARPLLGSATAEAIVLILLGLLIGLVAVHYDAFEEIVSFVANHEEWQLDELLTVLLVCGLSGIAVGMRRNSQLRREVAKREEAERQARQLARHDPLTGLPNRRVFMEELEKRLRHTIGTHRTCSVLLIDLDRFKPINDLHGHSTGDVVLRQIADRLKSSVRAEDHLARLSGDEFAVVIETELGSDAPMRLAKRLIGTIAEPILHEQSRFDVGASIGIAVCPPEGASSESLVREADLAMYRGKREGRGTVRYFEPAMDAELRSRQALEAKLRHAVETQRIRPHYQPLVCLETRQVMGFELLARWYDPDEGLIMPDSFISVAEDVNLISEISYAILRQACREARFWPDHVIFALNISPSQLKDPSLSESLLGILAEEGFRPDRLEIEITESALVGDLTVAKQTLEILRREGIRIVMDDFGTGYSGLFHLRELRFDKLKIDRSFVRNLDDPESMKIVHAIVGLGKSLGLPTTAEGIEDAAHLEKLIELGCVYGQGFHFGKPQPASANEISSVLRGDVL
jgi:diguanylate cyclase (GGDEF)-like protein